MATLARGDVDRWSWSFVCWAWVLARAGIHDLGLGAAGSDTFLLDHLLKGLSPHPQAVRQLPIKAWKQGRAVKDLGRHIPGMRGDSGGCISRVSRPLSERTLGLAAH